MRDIPGLSTDVLSRAGRLSAKARAAREAAPGTVPPSASIAPARVTNGTAVLRLYDFIDGEGGYWGISADELAQALDAVEVDFDQIELRINSGGGAVWDGLAILNTLRAHDAPVTAVVDGVAASAASFIAVACDEVVMMPNSRLMIHDALGLCIGQAVDMREYADFLDDTSDNIAEIYATKAGGEVAAWRATMTAKGLIGQWYSAQDALDVGLIDRVEGKTDPPEDKAGAQPSAAVKPEPAPEPESTNRVEEARNEREARFRTTQHQMAAERHGFDAA